MKKSMIASPLAAFLLVCLAAPAAWADDVSPVGVWKNIDDATGRPRALIRITETNGMLQGQIEKLFRLPEEDQTPHCDKCSGDKKDKPMLGMIILSGLKKDGYEYSGGEIVDPENGKTYRSKLTLIEDGKKLEVRGYIGMPMLGRSQIWLRQN